MMSTRALLSGREVRFSHSVEAARSRNNTRMRQAPRLSWNMMRSRENEGALQRRLRHKGMRCGLDVRQGIAMAPLRIRDRRMAN